MFRRRKQANGLTLEQCKASIAALLMQTYYERHVMPPLYQGMPGFHDNPTFSQVPQGEDFDRMVEVLFERLSDYGLEIVATKQVDANTVALIRLGELEGRE